jgi:hypothetical protein
VFACFERNPAVYESITSASRSRHKLLRLVSSTHCAQPPSARACKQLNGSCGREGAGVCANGDTK